MGQKIRAFSIFMILLMSALFSVHFLEGIGADEAESDAQEVALYMYGDPGNATLNTSYGYYEEQHVLTTNDAIEHAPFPNTIFIGEWVTEPIAYPMDIYGDVRFRIYAVGNLMQVRFTASLIVNGVEVSNEMITERQNLNETIPAEFVTEPINLTQPLELNTTDVIGLRLSLDHNDPQYLPIISGGKNVTLVFGYGLGSFVGFSTISIRIIDIEGRDDPVTKNMIVTSTVKCSFGYEDFNYATIKSDYGPFMKLSETVLDDATVEVEWEWDYTVTEGGSYPVKVTVVDKNYSGWDLTKDIAITTPNTEIDFSLSTSDISFSDDPQKNKNTTVTAKITGSGRRWTSYQVDIEFYDDSDLIENVVTTIKRGGTNEVSVLWTPDTSGMHRIIVKVDPDDDFSETDEDNNEAYRNADVKEGSGSGTPGFESLLLIVAIAVVLFVGRRYRRAE